MSSASMVQPVGLLGELSSSRRVPGLSACSSPHVQRPSAVRYRQRVALDAGAEDARNLGQVGPERSDGDDAVARLEQQLRGQHDARYP